MSGADVEMDELVRAEAAPAAPNRDATATAEVEDNPVSERRRPHRWRAVPVLAAVCVAAVVATQMWRMSAPDGVGLEAAATRSGRLSAGILAFKDPTQSSYKFAHEFATKTAYWDQRAERERPADRELLKAPAVRRPRVFRPDLQLVQTQVVARHGIRCVL